MAVSFPQFRLWPQLFGLLLLLFGSAAQASEVIQEVKDLRQLKQQAADAKLPVLLLFSTPDCVYCEAIRRDYLIPLQSSEAYRQRILFRQVDMSDFNLLRNLEGELIGGDTLALKFDVELAPTIVFIAADGLDNGLRDIRQLAPRIVGLSNPDYFDQILRKHIHQASKTLMSLQQQSVQDTNSSL